MEQVKQAVASPEVLQNSVETESVLASQCAPASSVGSTSAPNLKSSSSSDFILLDHDSDSDFAVHEDEV